MVQRAVTPDQHNAWQLAPLIAGRSRVRLARWSRRLHRWEYAARDERNLGEHVPHVPAAVMIYNSKGQCRTLVADVDVPGAEGLELVHRVVSLLERCGARVIVDRSPAGKHHVYVPLRDGLGAEDAGDLAGALSRRFPGVDPMPHKTGAASGCIRPPGSPYKDGKGWQELVTPLDTARRTLLVRNGSDVLRALRRELREELAGAARERIEVARPAEELEAGLAAVLDGPSGRSVMAPRLLSLAQEGTYLEAGYQDRSTARMAVLCAAARAGLVFEDVACRIEDGRWAGMSVLLEHANKPSQLLGREWRKACALVARTVATQKSVRHCNTSEAVKVTRGDHAGTDARALVIEEHRFIRRWRAVLADVESAEFSGPRGLTARFLLRALAAAAHQAGSRHLEFGARSLSLSMPADPSTVARVLAELREGDDPWLVLIQEARGTRADLYELRIPERHADVAERIWMHAGKVHALRPAFRELGTVAALLFEAVERGAGSVDLARVRAGISRSAAYEGLELLESWGLIERDAADRLVARADRLEEVAERAGAVLVVGLLIERYREDRRIWRLHLGRHLTSQEWWESVAADQPPPEGEEPPPEDPERGLHLVA